MIYLLIGDEDFLAQEALKQHVDSLGPPDLVSLSTVKLEGARLSFAELQQACDTVPFLSPVRLVIVTGLLTRFERGRRGAGDSGEADNAPAPGRGKRGAIEDGWDRLAEYATHFPESTHLVLVDSAVGRANPIRSAVSATATVREFGKLRGPALEEWVGQRVAQLQCSITPAASRRLLDLAGNNLWMLSSELEKLSLYASGETIRPEQVDELVSLARESNIFALVDAVAAKRLQQAHQALRRLLMDGAAAPYVLFMLARQFRLLLLAKTLGEQKIGGQALMNRLGIRSEYPFRKTVEQARGYTAPVLEATLRRLLEADVAMKTGRQGPDLALELLVTDLCRGAVPVYQS